MLFENVWRCACGFCYDKNFDMFLVSAEEYKITSCFANLVLAKHVRVFEGLLLEQILVSQLLPVSFDCLSPVCNSSGN